MVKKKRIDKTGGSKNERIENQGQSNTAFPEIVRRNQILVYENEEALS